MFRLGLLIAFLGCAAPALAGGVKAEKDKYVLPGITPQGSVKLPNTWSIKQVGKQIELGDFPVNIALHPNGKWAAVLHAGYGTHEIIIVDIASKKQRIKSRVTLDQTFYGLAFSADGKTLVASGSEFDLAHAFAFDAGYLYKHREIKLAGPKEKFITGGVTLDPEGKTVFACGIFGHAVAMAPLDESEEHVTIPLAKDSYPYACLVSAGGKRLYVSLWGKAQVAVIDVQKRKVIDTFETEKHPTEMVLGPEEKTLFVACANSTRVSVLRTDDGKPLETINCALYPAAPNGNTPSSLCLTPNGELLFVGNANVNNVAVFNVATPGQARPLGFIPTGIYPTSVRFNAADKRLYIANGRGLSPKANPHGPNPLEKNPTAEYIAGLYRGTLGILDMPTETKMVEYSKTAYQCSPLREDQGVVGPVPKDSPIPTKLGQTSPIKHVIYIIRENRTYDQVFGDLVGGNGDPNLCLFSDKVTPNAHKLARQFVLLDNVYCDGEVSAEGHEWSMGAYCTDFVRKFWPLTYRGSDTKKLKFYPSEGEYDDIARPAGGYLWDRCAEAKVTYRSYGEWVKNGKTLKDPATATVKALEGHIDPWFRGWDLDYPDVKRAERFIEELHRFEKDGGMPQMQIVRLPNDHTAGTKSKAVTPTGMIAENDLALGLLVEAVTKSKYWPQTAIFVIEDDAQNGADHVDAHRTVALVISPYTQHGKVDSTMYSTASLLRTMELILALKPMSQFDAAARPMYNAFQSKPNLDPYTHLAPDVDMKATNKATAWGQKLSDGFDFTKEDAVDDLVLNEIIWRSVKGDDAPMPPPVHSAFVFPHVEMAEEKE